MKITVKPLQGIFWENNSILLGEKIESVRRTFINTNIRTEFYNSNPSFFLFDNDLCRFVKHIGRRTRKEKAI